MTAQERVSLVDNGYVLYEKARNTEPGSEMVQKLECIRYQIVEH